MQWQLERVSIKEAEKQWITDTSVKFFCKRGEYDKAQEYYEKALTIHMEIGKKEGVVVSYNDLGLCFQSLGKYDMAEEYVKQALLLSRDI